MMTEIDHKKINKTITEAMGKCWHEFDIPKSYKCKCGIYFDAARNEGLIPNPSYTFSWEAYGQVLEWAQKQEWWIELIKYNYGEEVETSIDRLKVIFWNVPYSFMTRMLSTLSGSTALAEFIKEHPEYFKKGEKE